ncbi:FkbM family methyltransferase [Aquipuribacter nitratireducens]|uniref:FkbM family methyltransferase n=1 Tax=Aquipuribacter nitratireducens TaxID=650104 RepID=A0ABW0GJ44_9MICO
MEQGTGAVAAGLTTVRADGVEYLMALPDRGTDYIQRSIADTGAPYEARMLRAMAQWAGEGDLVVDAGANVGNHTVFLAAVRGCRVLAIEPDPHLCAAVERSVAANDLAHLVRVECAGLGAEAGLGRLVVGSGANVGAQRLEVGDGGVPVTTLDALLAGEAVHVVKIDVEGMEWEVLRGAERTLAEHRPVLFVEAAEPGGLARLSAWLRERGYAYVDTFNATPTHLFVRDDHPRLLPELIERHERAVRDRLELEARSRSAEQRLAVARRALARPRVPADGAVGDGAPGDGGASVSTAAALGRHAQERLRAALGREERALVALREAVGEVERLVEESERQRADLERAAHRLATLRRSRLLRSAAALRRTGSARDVVTLPARLLRAMRPVAVPAPAATVAGAPPTSRAVPQGARGGTSTREVDERLAVLATTIAAGPRSDGPDGPRVAVVAAASVGGVLAPACALTMLSQGGWRDEVALASPELVVVAGTGAPAYGGWPDAEGVELLAWAGPAGVPVVHWRGSDDPPVWVQAVPATLDLPPAVDLHVHGPVAASPRARTGVVVVGAGPDAEVLRDRVEAAGAAARLLAPAMRLDPGVGRKTAVIVIHPSVGPHADQLVVQALACGAAVVAERHGGALDDLLADVLAGDSTPGRLAALAADDRRRAVQRARALTAVAHDHTGLRRLQQLAAAAGAALPAPSGARVLALLAPPDAAAAERLVATVARQADVRVPVVALAAGDAARVLSEGLPDAVVLGEPDDVAAVVAERLLVDVDLVAVLHEDDRYGEDYLSGLALGRLCSDGEVFGKADPGAPDFVVARRLPVRRSATAAGYAHHVDWADALLRRDDAEIVSGRCVVLDAEGYQQGVDR